MVAKLNESSIIFVRFNHLRDQFEDLPCSEVMKLYPDIKGIVSFKESIIVFYSHGSTEAFHKIDHYWDDSLTDWYYATEIVDDQSFVNHRNLQIICAKVSQRNLITIYKLEAGDYLYN